jgi:hypothetical protein
MLTDARASDAQKFVLSPVRIEWQTPLQELAKAFCLQVLTSKIMCGTSSFQTLAAEEKLKFDVPEKKTKPWQS